jgi:hypothetical protein
MAERRTAPTAVRLARHPPIYLLRDQSSLGLGQQGSTFGQGETKFGKAAVTPLDHGQGHRTPAASPPSSIRASMINRMVFLRPFYDRQRSRIGAASRVNRSPNATLGASHTFAHSHLH